MMRLLAFFSLLLIGLAAAARADGLIVVPNSDGVRPDHFRFAPLYVTYHKVNVTIKGQFVTTEVDQEFVNPTGSRLEGDYLFPLPKDASISKFSMTIGDKMVDAEFLPAEKARKIYEEIVRKAKDPALLEYAERSLFRVRIFPIEPNEHKRIRLSYTELLPETSGVMHYHYTLNTEKYSSRLLEKVSVQVAVEKDRPITTFYSPSHNVKIDRPTDKSATVRYEAANVRPDTDFHLYIGTTTRTDMVDMKLLTYRPAGEDEGYFLLTLAPTQLISGEAMPKDVLFVIDTSGSMAGAKIDQAKKALQYCVNVLSPADRFDIVRFSTDTEKLFGQMSRVDAASRAKAIDFIGGMKAAGGTAIDAAQNAAVGQLQDSPAGRLKAIVFLTDGLPTVGQSNPDRILDQVSGKLNAIGARVFAFGVGNDVNTRLLDLLASQSRGSSQYVLPNEDIEVAVSTFFSRITEPMLTGLALNITGVSTSRLMPRELPDLYKGDQLILFGTYKLSGTASVEFTATRNGKKTGLSQEMMFPESTSAETAWIAKLWATRRIGFLLDEMRLHAKSEEVKDEIVALSRKYGIITPYTAALIMEDETSRGVPLSARTLSEMEKDRGALERVQVGASSVAQGRATGGQAVSDAVNSADYSRAANLQQAEAAAAQKERRAYFEGQDRAALAKSFAPGAPTATAAPAAKPDGGYRDSAINYAQQNRLVNGRTFYQNGNQWQDARIQSLKNAQRQQIKFGSDDYFALLKKHPESAQWLALGNNVSFEMKGVIYEVTE